MAWKKWEKPFFYTILQVISKMLALRRLKTKKIIGIKAGPTTFQRQNGAINTGA